MTRYNNFPLVQTTNKVVVSSEQEGLVSRGLIVLKSMAADAQDDNNAARQWELGCEYIKGSEAERDYERAFYWFNNAAEQGHAEAQFALGSLYASGNGVKKSAAQAVAWYSKAADQGHAWASRMLADMLGLEPHSLGIELAAAIAEAAD
jgi:TPR repeat protein